jgi:hypothetical protein
VSIATVIQGALGNLLGSVQVFASLTVLPNHPRTKAHCAAWLQIYAAVNMTQNFHCVFEDLQRMML